MDWSRVTLLGLLALTVMITAVEAINCYFCKDQTDGVCKEVIEKECNDAAVAETVAAVKTQKDPWYEDDDVDTDPGDSFPDLSDVADSSESSDASNIFDENRRKRSDEEEYGCAKAIIENKETSFKLLVKGCARRKKSKEDKCKPVKDQLGEGMACRCNSNHCNSSTLPKCNSIWILGLVCLLLLAHCSHLLK